MVADVLPLRLLIIQATPFCNINCSYCYLPNRNFKQQIHLDVVKEVFRNVFTSKIINKGFTTVWHAGEPLMMPIPFYQEVIDYVRQYNNSQFDIRHSFQTNATLLNQDWCDFILRNNEVKIGVSIDGPDFIHDQQRLTRSGKGTFSKAMRGIELLKKNRIPFEVITVVTKSTLPYADELHDFFIQNKIFSVGLNFEEQEGVNKQSTLNNDNTYKDFKHFIHRFYTLSKNSPLKVREFENVTNSIKYNFNTHKNQVSKPFGMINVDVNGNFSTFSPELLTAKNKEFGDFILGNIFDTLISESTKTEKFNVIYNQIKKGIKNCENECDYFSLCGGGSPSNKYAELNTLEGTETNYCKHRVKSLVDIILPDLEKELSLV